LYCKKIKILEGKEFIFPGTSSDEIDDFVKNNLNIREDNERKYLYPQYLYGLLLQRKYINTEFKKPDNMGIKEYHYECTTAFNTIFSPIVTELEEVCNSKQYSSII
jgi:hypothetical protein